MKLILHVGTWNTDMSGNLSRTNHKHNAEFDDLDTLGSFHGWYRKISIL